MGLVERAERELSQALTRVERFDALRPLPTATEETLAVIRASDIRPEPIRWLWEGWLAKGKKHVLAGAAGTGKTTLAVAIAAILTKGGYWPDGTRAEKGNVVIWSGEDDPKDTLVPRLMAAGADLNRIYFVGDVSATDGGIRAFDSAHDVPLLDERIRQIGGAALAIVDPVVNAVAGDSHKNGEVRRALAPLVDLAQKHDVAILGITHFSKGTQGKDPLDRVTGSLAFGAVARIVLVAAKSTPDETDVPPKRLFARAKSNIGPDDGGFHYEIKFGPLTADPLIETSWVEWGGPVDGSARELLSEMEPDDGSGSAVDDAEAFLRDLLERDAKPQKDVRKLAAAEGHAWATVRRAKDRLGVVAKKEGMHGPWKWRLCPEDAQRIPKMPNTQSGASSGANEHLRQSGSPPDEWEPVE